MLEQDPKEFYIWRKYSQLYEDEFVFYDFKLGPHTFITDMLKKEKRKGFQKMQIFTISSNTTDKIELCRNVGIKFGFFKGYKNQENFSIHNCQVIKYKNRMICLFNRVETPPISQNVLLKEKSVIHPSIPINNTFQDFDDQKQVLNPLCHHLFSQGL